MKYKIINDRNENYSAIEQVLVNRGIDINEIAHYLYTTDNDINSFELFGKDKLRDAAVALIKTIQSNSKALVIVDSDCDGMTSAAILINYLHEYFPSWVENSLEWFLHEGKEHGLSDCVDYILQKNFSLVFCPDSASNDYQQHKQLKDSNIACIVLDHHEAEKISEDAIIINNQLCEYPNKAFSGAGVTYQFCKYLDSVLNDNKADEFLDLCALGNCADMMSLTSIETKHLINKGFKQENIKNPFIYNIAQKNSYSLGNEITSMGAAFYIVPFVNAMIRSGTKEEKEMLFKSMLNFKAFDMIPSTKRGHSIGEKERIVDQVLRLCTNVKNRQTKAQDLAMSTLEEQIEKNDMMQHKVLLFLLERNEIDKNVAGLVANKIMAKYQRPCCILTKVVEVNSEDTLPWEEPKGEQIITYQGSARGCDKTGVLDFKQICLDAGAEWGQGHPNAFGLCIAKDKIKDFINKTDIALEDISSEPLYYVDFMYDNININSQDILEIAECKNLWGKDIDEPFILIKRLDITKDMLTLMGLEKGKPTLKITIPNTKISLIKFGSNEDEYNSLLSENGSITVNIIGRCNKNEWMGNITPQILIEDYEIIGNKNYIF